MMLLRLCLAMLVAWLGPIAAKASDISYSLPLGSFTFAPGSASHYLSPYIGLIGNNGTQFSQRIKENGYYSITISATLASNHASAPAPIALFVDGLPQGHGPDPVSGSDYVWNVTNQGAFAKYTAANIYLYAGTHTVGMQCLACSLSTTTALIGAVTLELTSTAAPPYEPTGQRDPTVQPLRSYNIWNTSIGSGAVWSSKGDPDTQAIINSALGATINSGCWSVPVYVAKTTDPVGFFATPTYDVMPISSGYFTNIPTNAQPACGTDANITLYDPTHRWMQEFLSCSPTSLPKGFQCYYNLMTDVCEGQNPTGTFTSWTPGLIRVSDIQKRLISHMLSFAMPTTMTKPPANWWQISWPEYQVDLCGPTCYSGVVPAGSTIGIPSTVNLSALGLTPAGLVLATALQDYGAIQRSTGGRPPQGIILYAEQAAERETPSQLADMRSDFVKIQPYLRVMRNQASNNVNGGGTPRRPMQPRIDPSICP
jgi:hypothetical protein